MPKHTSRLDHSARLQRVLKVLRQHPEGITSLELLLASRVTDVKDVVYELRRQGIAIVGQLERRPQWSSPRYVYRLVAQRMPPQPRGSVVWAV
jgi:hypothetical protein